MSAEPVYVDLDAVREDIHHVLAKHGLDGLDLVQADVRAITQDGIRAGVSITALAYTRPRVLAELDELEANATSGS